MKLTLRRKCFGSILQHDALAAGNPSPFASKLNKRRVSFNDVKLKDPTYLSCGERTRRLQCDAMQRNSNKMRKEQGLKLRGQAPHTEELAAGARQVLQLERHRIVI